MKNKLLKKITGPDKLLKKVNVPVIATIAILVAGALLLKIIADSQSKVEY